MDSTTLKFVGAGFLAIVAVIVLYKIYKKYQEKLRNEPIFFNTRNVHGIFRDTTRDTMISDSKLPPSSYGMEYSYSFWINISDFNYLYGKPKHIMHKGPKDISVCNPGVFLAPKTNQLIIRVDTKETNSVYNMGKDRRINDGSAIKTLYDVSEDDCKRECSFNTDCNAFTLDHLANQCTFFSNKLENSLKALNNYPEVKGVNSYSKLKSMNPDYYSEFELDSNLPCDIIDIPLQRWNHIAIVLWNRSLDVYLNGKLARSCTLRSIPQINNGPLWITQNGGFKGDMASLRYFNRAINPEEVYKLYKSSPDELLLSRKLLPNIQVSFKATADTGADEDIE